ncbi:MAG: MotA/TolQ/ExbB proton channel family protein, partial [Candidatus Stahlbacteria bacterium]|nr:MotA/TolQ/ExbB proton channel family protein [Candidatus Stahlbacteria bacterium]
MIAGINLLDIAKISPVFDILILCSVMALAAMLQRFLVYKNQHLDVGPFMEKIRALMGKGQYSEAVEICSETNRPLSNMIKAGLENIELGRKNVSDLMEAQKLSVREELERYLPILGTLGNSAPFIGLLGTVIGIIRAFKLLEAAESMGPTAIMIGIAEALVTTAMGLIVAVPCVILFNWFMERV